MNCISAVFRWFWRSSSTRPISRNLTTFELDTISERDGPKLVSARNLHLNSGCVMIDLIYVKSVDIETLQIRDCESRIPQNRDDLVWVRFGIDHGHSLKMPVPYKFVESRSDFIRATRAWLDGV